ncbi:hypothetical protein [Pseudomonas fluorescens]|jgi:hypothetical protein|uniref:hypothetical protein n=1 Tax=Pseudomonas fluorescens TaxID=294 RepID=UPI001269BB8D|nr:hypothetical protein [Pseudomonas fluorescens]
MNNLIMIVDKIKSDWSTPRRATHFGYDCPFLLSSHFSMGIKNHSHTTAVTSELIKMWEIFESADLFKDDKYGQWGIKILSPEESIKETSSQKAIRGTNITDKDTIFGLFYGDSDFLLIDSHGEIYVGLPLDDRKYWPKVANSIEDFLVQLNCSQGAKYWESQNQTPR